MFSRGKKIVDLALAQQKSSSDESEYDSSGESYVPPISDSDSDLSDAIQDSDGSQEDEISVSNITQSNDNPSCWRDIHIGEMLFPVFSQPSSPKNISLANNRPLDFYKLLVDEEIFEHIVQQTNHFAQELILSDSVKPKSRLKKWEPITESDLKKIFSLIIWFGINPVPELQNPWSRDSFFHNSFVSSTMPRDRFILIMRCLHFSDNAQNDANDRLCKIRPLSELLIKNFQKYFSIGGKVVIDETMIPWRGRLLFKQYIANKRHKYGIKVYKLCSSEGYIYNFRIYCGKGEKIEGVSHGEYIINTLLENSSGDSLLGQGRCVIADNFYSSISLAEDLLNKQTRYCGTLRANRKGVPTEVSKQRMRRGQIIGKQKGDVKIIRWHDKKSVLMLTSVEDHDLALKETGKINRGAPVMKPQCILDYNKTKKGVDYSDQMSSYYTVLRKCKKWYRKVALELLFGSSMTNAWLLYNMTTHCNISFLEFRKSISKDLMRDAISFEEESSRPRTPKRIHTLTEIVGKKRKCSGCYETLRKTMSSREADNKVKKVKTYCQDCEKQPALCLTCFNKVHSNLI